MRKRQTVSVELPGANSDGPCRPDALSRVLTNLITNAIKYTPENGRIVVRLDGDPAHAGRVRVTVLDSGIGIDASEHERVFSGCYRSMEGRGSATGSGVGLSSTKRIV